jgi:dCMP deaminase
MKEDKLEIYMKMAHAMKAMSPDAETKVGAVMLSSEERIIASSFNGFLRGAIDKDLPKKRPGKHEFIQHAERNLLYNCAYNGISTKGTTIVCTLSPCLDCLRASFQSGVEFIMFEDLYGKFPDTGFYEKLDDVKVFVDKIGKYTRIQMLKKEEWENEQAEFAEFLKALKGSQGATNDEDS